MATKYGVVHDSGLHVWKISHVNKQGDEKVDDTIPDVEPMGEVEALQVFQLLITKETDARRAALSALAHIWMNGVKPATKIKLTQHVGKGDKKTGALGTGIKDDFRKAEDVYFDQWADEKHPQHKAYMGKLPKLNERSEELAPEDRHAYFVTRTRKNGSYANAKNLFLNYVAFVGNVPFDVDGDGKLIGLVPPEVMRKRIADAKADIPGADNTWEAKMQALLRELLAPSENQTPRKVQYERLPGLIVDMKHAVGKLEDMVRVFNASKAAGTRAAKGDVVGAGADMIERAQQSARVNPDNPAAQKQEPAAEEKAEPQKG